MAHWPNCPLEHDCDLEDDPRCPDQNEMSEEDIAISRSERRAEDLSYDRRADKGGK
jgi:hypothetical protein